ncbi:protein NPAT isoform X2 [Rana temporaria]|uniref:protein NPAT isoform X2 n=1 Tax=Rana temporaria TaxID=8407 RepID=UPI001AAD9DF1|nr:protein NPAT isoform X2 [Rana temporaria]
MLLPSDVARLVLGYLQQEKLSSTCRAYIAESPHLKEYADHHTDDGAIPGCLLSVFGKSLTTILNEYITMKAKENEADIPFMMSSLWKKLDHTLSQIRCMQESAAFRTNQRARTREGINQRMRQNILTSPLAVSGSSVSQPLAQQISTPVLATQYILCPINTPVTPQSGSSMTTVGQSALPSSIPTTTTKTTRTVTVASAPKKLATTATAATSSPMRRKPDTQRRRRMAPISNLAAEKETSLDIDSIQGLIDDDFPQLVIENARDKILSNKSLQEKLADNINKILASDCAAQTSKQVDGTAVDQDASIDEILGLQGGEIHMSEEAINDILVQTELDPDFQGLYDLFACVSSKAPKGTPRDPPSSLNVETKTSGSEKRKQNVVEDANSRERAGNKMDDCLRESETDNSLLNNSDAGTPLKDEADRSSTMQQTCVNESTASGSPKVHTQSSELVICMESSVSEVVIESSEDLHQTELETSYTQPQDVEMENISLTNEGTEDCCFIVEDILPQAPMSPEKSEPTNMCSKDSENEEPSEGATNEKLLDKSQEEQEGNKSIAASQPSTIAPQGNTLLVPAPALNCSGAQDERDHQPVEASKISPLNKLAIDAKDKQEKENDSGKSIEKDTELQKPSVNVAPSPCHEQNSLGPEMEPSIAEITVPSSSQAAVDPSTIVTLNLIAEDYPEEAELNNAVRSIHEENYPTIILSPLVKSQEIRRIGPSQNGSGDLMESSVVGEQCPLLATSSDGSINTINIPNGDGTVYAVSGTSTTTDGSVIQLVTTSSSTFAPSNSLFISSCVASNVPSKQPNIIRVSNSSAPNSSQTQAGLFQTPPRPGSMYTIGQAISPKLSQGSTIILASPVQPVLQGVMSMFPVSLVGQSGSNFTTQPHQILHVPVSKPVVPKLPLPPKFQKSLPKPSANTASRPDELARRSERIRKSSSNPAADSISRPSSLVQRENEEKNSTSEIQQKAKESSVPEALNTVSKSVEAHRRVLCFDGSSTLFIANSSSSSNEKSRKDKNDTIQNDLASTEAVSSKISVSKETKKNERSAPSLGKSFRVDQTIAQAKDQPGEKRATSLGGAYGVNKENVLKVGTQIHPAGQIDKKTTSSQDNLRTEKNLKPPQDPVRKHTSLPNILRKTPQKVSSERVCSTSPLAKQASQLLQDMQFHSPNSLSAEDVPPRTPGRGYEDKVTDNSDHTRTPTCRRYNEDGGTPKPMMPPATPDMPTCSPASEAGSENSVNMAAHTLMILSRASIAKTSSSTPLKDNTHQSKPSKSTAKKRRLEDSDEHERRSHRKELLSPSSSQKKKKMKQRKKSADNFPTGMDVEKFLMTLHYDE